MDIATLLPTLLGVAWLLPLASFTLIVFFGPKMGKAGVLASYVATGAIVTAFALSATALICWAASSPETEVAADHDHEHGKGADHKATSEHKADDHSHEHEHEHASVPPRSYTGTLYTLGKFGNLEVTVSYYIDALTVGMFAMVTLIASCIHFYAIGYMHDELHPVTDTEVLLPAHTAEHGHGEHGHDEHEQADHGHGHATVDEHGHESHDVAMQLAHAPAKHDDHGHGAHGHEAHGHDAHGDDAHGHGHHGPQAPEGMRYLTRPGRFHRFFQYLSLFCFSMLGLVYAGNIAMVFVFWELVGICSYFLIGFYIERKSASTAANKAFIVNRVGDFGMIIGLMALWGSLGTFAFGDLPEKGPGIFSQVRTADNHYELQTPDGMVLAASGEELSTILREHKFDSEIAKSEMQTRIPALRDSAEKPGYWLLVIAGLGIFCGCVGKSAQFPLHVWLPDAMEGPTPVSALVHSATMVAAGVYLVGRFYPVFAPEVLLTIAYIGGITLFIAATIAITATDIKRVLAYSTVSQLGYMMLALGVGGWLAGMLHLITHAFFKSLLFMCSGSVIHACHTNEMPRMGGLRKKMPYTAYTMLIGCLAIAGAPFFSGFYSKDAIIAQALSFANDNPSHSVLFYAVATGAAITAFYMFRLWYMTFAGTPREPDIYDHAHESPPVMYRPLVLLSVFAVACAWPIFGLVNLLEQARPAGEIGAGVLLPLLAYPNEHASHDYHALATLIASATALAGFLLATVFYGKPLLNAAEAKAQFKPIYTFLLHKWYFDELYHTIFIRPVLFISGVIARFDKQVIDGFIDSLARGAKNVAKLDDLIDRYFVDGIVNLLAHWTWSVGRSLRSVQTGRLRQYVMFIVVGTVILTVLIQWSAAAGR